MNKSESIKDLATALSKAQSQMEGAKKDDVNPFFKSKYADLASVWEACRKPLTDNELSVIQTPNFREGQIPVLETTLLHSSGDWVSGVLILNPVKNDPQGMGSAITYARRYSLAAMVGICPEDDDAESTMDRKKTESKPKKESPVVAAAKEQGAVPKEHWCEEHKCEFFMKGKMKSFAHPIGDTGKWCHEHKEEPEAIEEIVSEGELKNAGEFLNKCLDVFKLNKEQVETAIGTEIKELKDYDGAFVYLTAAMKEGK